jgi:hypothetical protein
MNDTRLALPFERIRTNGDISATRGANPKSA